MESNQDILNTIEGANLLRMSPAKLRELATGGALPAYRVGNRWRFRRADLLEWVERMARANVAPECADTDSLDAGLT